MALRIFYLRWTTNGSTWSVSRRGRVFAAAWGTTAGKSMCGAQFSYRILRTVTYAVPTFLDCSESPQSNSYPSDNSATVSYAPCTEMCSTRIRLTLMTRGCEAIIPVCK